MIKIIKNPIFWIFILAIFLRIYRLGEFPYGFHVDEAKVAWNTLSILKTGHDDQNRFLGLYYNSFGDYRPSGIFYFTIPSITIFGRSIFATRFPVALFGALTIFPIYFLVEMLDKKAKNLAAFLFAISPWSIDLSRATDETVISTFFAILSVFFFIKLIKSRKKKFGAFTIISLLISYLLYHSIRFLGPIFLISIFIFYFKDIKNRKIKRLSLFIIGFSIVLTLFFGLDQGGLSRLSQTSIFQNVDTVYQMQRVANEDLNKNPLTIVFDNKLTVYFGTFAGEFGKYFSEGFLAGTDGRPYRFATPGIGVLTYAEIILLIIGIVQVVQGKKNLLPVILLILAPLPAALTSEDAPNLSRAFLMLPFFIILEAYGLEKLFFISRKFQKQIVVIDICDLNTKFFLFSVLCILIIP